MGRDTLGMNMDMSGHNWRFPGADYSAHRNPQCCEHGVSGIRCDVCYGDGLLARAEEYVTCVERRFGDYYLSPEKVKEYRKKKLDKQRKR